MSNKRGYIKFLNENLGVIGGVDSMNSVSMSDPVHSADVFLDPNAPVLNLYSNGDGFKIHDNSSLYEVIKIFKDRTDREPMFQSCGYAIDVNNKRLVFSMVTDNDHMITGDYVNGMIETLRSDIQRLFGDTFEITSEEKDVFGEIGQDVGLGPSQGKKEVLVYVVEKEKKAEDKSTISIEFNPTKE